MLLVSALKETVIDEGAEARVLRAVNHPIRSSSSLLTPFNLELHSTVLKLQEFKDKGRETSKCMFSLFSLSSQLLFLTSFLLDMDEETFKS